MKKNDILIEDIIIQQIPIPHINEHKNFPFPKRQNSMRNLNKGKKKENILPKKRNIKSREKELIKPKLLPLIKKNNTSKSKTITNFVSKPKNFIKKKETNNDKLPNLVIKKTLNNFKQKNNNRNVKDNNNTIINLEINENTKNNDLFKNIGKETNNNFNLDNMTKFYEEFIDLSNSIQNKTLFNSLINTFHKKYVLNFTSNMLILQIEDLKFKEFLKYTFIIIALLLLLSKDETNLKYTGQRIKELLDQFIFTALKNIKIDFSTKIKAFINRMKPTRKALNNCINAIIKLLYNNKNEYTSLKNAFNQIVKNINKINLNDVSNIINNSILYCFNYQNFKSTIPLKNNLNNNTHNTHNINKNNKNKKCAKNKIEQNKNQNEELIPSPPYIKTEMEKKFCLVLDIDETITHTLKLPFGDYFLVRPGVKDFLEEMIKYFEIVIFTSSPKSYADNILDKIDINNEFFSYRLYRKHVCYENGNSVKKLDMIGRDLKKIVFVDNLKSNAKYNPSNLYHIKSWINDMFDNQLIILKNKLKDIVISGKYDDDITKGIYNIK